METTLLAIREHGPCEPSWRKLLASLGKTKADDEPLRVEYILDNLGLDDALWSLRAVTGHDRVIRLLAVRYARQVQRLMRDPRSITALDVAERFAEGVATLDELGAARAAASDAAWAAARDASDAASDAARIAAMAAARAAAAAASDEAWEAAAWAARIAAMAAAWAAAWDASAAASAAARAAQAAELRRICRAATDSGDSRGEG
jgi:hypothetical protein